MVLMVLKTKQSKTSRGKATRERLDWNRTG